MKAPYNDAAEMFGCGFIILALCLGMGGCSWLIDHSKPEPQPCHCNAK